MKGRLRVGDLVAYSGDDDPDFIQFDGQPGVVIDLGYNDGDPSVSFASGLSTGLSAQRLVPIDIDQYRERAERMRRGWHPVGDERITPLDIGDPLSDARQRRLRARYLHLWSEIEMS
jgi:hypothetical protein